MSERASGAGELARLCAALPELRRQAQEEGWADELQRTVDEVERARRPAARLARFWRRIGLPAAGEEYRDAELSPAWRRAEAPLAVLPGQDAGAPPDGAYRCPRRRCSRVVRREPGGPVPMCELDAAPMRF